jgi:hypothetical protein
MDAKMTSYINEISKEIIFDFVVNANGCVPMITGEEEDLQHAQVSVFLTRNSIPQLKDNTHGVDWLGFLTDNVKFGIIDSQIRDNLNYVGQADNFYPNYVIENEKLKLELRKQP